MTCKATPRGSGCRVAAAPRVRDVRAGAPGPRADGAADTSGDLSGARGAPSGAPADGATPAAGATSADGAAPADGAVSADGVAPDVARQALAAVNQVRAGHGAPPLLPTAAPRDTAQESDPPVLDLIGVGIGPFNLSLAALADGEPALRSLFLERRPDFRWHPGLLVAGATLQVPFLADLVSLVDPTSPWSFLNYLRAHDRLFPFYFAERFHLPRREYDHYCRWVAGQLPHCRFSSAVTAARWDAERQCFSVDVRDEQTGAHWTAHSRNLVLGVGTEPVVPEAFRELTDHPRVWPAARYLERRALLDTAGDITVLGSGQSGAEVFLDLLRHAPGPRLRWLTRSAAIAPMEYSKLGLEHFTPDYTRYFHALPAAVRERLLAQQNQLYKAAGAETLADIHDALYTETLGGAPSRAEILPGTAVEHAEATAAGGVLLHCHHRESGTRYTLRTDAVVLATGYAARRPALLEPLSPLVDWDEHGRYRVDLDHRVALRPGVSGGLYVQNAELHTHGVGTPDLGLGAHRAATILNSIAGHPVHRLPSRTAYTTFGPAADAIRPDGPYHATSPTLTDDRTPTQERTHAAGR